MIRGLITFNKRQCYFSLENFNLILEEIENRTDVSNDDLQELLRIKKIDIPDILVGRTFNNRQIVFKVMHGYKKAFKTYFFRIQLYVVFKTLETSFDAIQFKAEELNSFYPLKNAYSITSKEQTGEIEFVARPFTELERNFTFNFKEELINGKLNISRNIDWNNKSPLSLHTELTLYFEKSSDDYNKLQELTYAFINALSFLTYRKNISINEVSLKKIDEKSGDYLKIGTLHVLREGIKHIEEDPRIIRENIVDISIIEDNLGVLFESMLHKKNLFKAFPDNSKEKNLITPSRFMMATAGFEWQYDLSKGQGKEKAEEGIERENLHEFSEQEKEILAFLEEKIESHTGEKKRYFKGIRNLVKRSSIKLSDKIEWTLIKYSDVLEGLIKNIYNTEKISFKEIAVRIARYRNKIAHGDISESHKDIVFDLRVIELLYYVMVLDYIGVSKEKNLKALSSVGL